MRKLLCFNGKLCKQNGRATALILLKNAIHFFFQCFTLSFFIIWCETISESRSFPENCRKILWDNSVTDKDVFVVLDGDNVLHTFVVYPDDVEEGGTSCVNLGQTNVFSPFLDRETILNLTLRITLTSKAHVSLCLTLRWAFNSNAWSLTHKQVFDDCS